MINNKTLSQVPLRFMDSLISWLGNPPLDLESPVVSRKNEWLFLFCAVIASLVFHAPFIFHTFGEPDAARLAISAVVNSTRHDYHFKDITVLFDYFLRANLSTGISRQQLPLLINSINCILGSLTLIPLYWLWRRLSNPRTAAAACLLFSVTPVFWLANTYCMPHLEAFFFLLCSVLACLKAFSASGIRVIAYTVLSICMVFLMLAMKFDFLLYSLIFPALLILDKNKSKRNITAAMSISLASALYVWMMFPSENTTDYVSQWHSTWPTDITALKAPSTYLAAGFVFVAGIILSGLYSLQNPRLRPYALFAMVWAAPAFLFWALRWQNGIRHMLGSYSVLIFLLSVVLTYRIPDTRRLFISIAILAVANYVLMPSYSVGVNSGGRFIETRLQVGSYYDKLSLAGKECAKLPYSHIAIIGTETIPFVVWEMFAHDTYVQSHPEPTPCSRWNPDTKQWDTVMQTVPNFTLRAPDGSLKTICWLVAYAPAELKSDSQWHYWTCEQGITIKDNP